MKPETLPLAGLNIVELESIGPVPFAGHLLRRLGAHVTLVGPPGARGAGIPIADDPLLAGKAPLRLDLKDRAGQRELLALLARSDVLIEGFRPGTLERLGLDSAVLCAANPTLVVGRCGGWGRESPRGTTAGHDINYLALAGILDAIGPRERPVPPLNLVGDFGGGAMHLALGVISAVLRARSTGRGCVVETSIFEAAVSLTAHLYSLVDAGLWREGRAANLLDGGAPFYRCYLTADGGWLAIGAIESKFFAELAEALGARIDATRQYDRTYWPEIEVEFSRCIVALTRDEWGERLGGSDVCATPVVSLAEARLRDDTLFAFDRGAPRTGLRFAEMVS